MTGAEFFHDNGEYVKMKRALFVFGLVASLFYLLGGQSWGGRRARAESGRTAGQASAELRHLVRSGRGANRVKVIIQPVGGGSTELDDALRANGADDVQQFRFFPYRVASLPAAAAEALAARPDVAYVSLDHKVTNLGHVTLTTGADAVRTTNGTTTSGLDGTGVGIAVLDSGLYANHKTFLDRSNNLRIVYSEDFTGEGRTDDPYGHGTHVASLAAGNGRISNAQYTQA